MCQQIIALVVPKALFHATTRESGGNKLCTQTKRISGARLKTLDEGHDQADGKENCTSDMYEAVNLNIC